MRRERRGEDRFGLGGWSEEHGVPVLLDAQACIICAKEDRFDYGSHTIFLGRVTSVGIHGAVDPLIYVDGHYTGLPADEVSAPPWQAQVATLYAAFGPSLS
jgi:flavin reductase (DIM6/NTAB) family NADH-FMN oxidoreductase RutF